MHNLKDLFETPLSVKEILKPNSVTGEPRATIMFNLIMNGSPIKLVNGREVVVDKRKSKEAIQVLLRNDPDEIAKIFIPKNRVFITTDGQQLRMNDFLKTDTFGGGKGSGAGAAQTDAQESAQAVALAIAAMKGKGVIDDSDLTAENAHRASDKYKIKVSLPEVVQIMSDRLWLRSLVLTTNALFRSFPNMKKMEFHHQSQWVKDFKAVFYTANNADNKFFGKVDKWNPADIWAMEPGFIVPKQEVVSNLTELKAWMQKQFDKKTLIGISLKKTGKTANVKVMNSDTEVSDLLDITIRDLLVSKTNKLFATKDSYVLYEAVVLLDMLLTEQKPSEVQFRSFGGDDPIQAELKRKFASHGKVGNSNINSILRSLGLPLLTSRNTILAMIDKTQKHPLQRYKKIIMLTIKNARLVNHNVARDAEVAFEKNVLDLDINKVISKFQAVEIVTIIKQAPPEAQDSFIQELIGMAASRTQLSSIFVKVY